VKDEYIFGKKIARNSPNMAIYQFAIFCKLAKVACGLKLPLRP